MEISPVNSGINKLTALFIRYILLFCATAYLVLYIAVVIYRINYPFELEWMEGAMVDHVRRILDGNQLYVAPSLDFVPYLYPPLYFYVSALMSVLLGTGFLPLRLVSFVSSLGCFFMIFIIVKQETGDKFSGILASSLFAATYKLSGAWFDISRIDSLFLFQLLAAIYFVRFGKSVKEYIMAGAVISLSFFTKQTALVISLALIPYSLFFKRKLSAFFIGTMIVMMGAGTLVLNHVYHGWYYYYLFDVPGQHPLVKEMIFSFWNEYILPLKIACVMSLFYLFSSFFFAEKEQLVFYLLFAVSMVAASWAGLLHKGGGSNVLMPAYSVIAIMFGIAFHTYMKLIKDMNFSKRLLMEIFIYLICILQFASGALRYYPSQFIPSRSNISAGNNFIRMIEEMKGEIFIPDHGYLSAMAGKKTYAHAMAIDDVLKSKGIVRDKLESEIRASIREKKFSAIILDSFEPFWKKEIENYYDMKKEIFKAGQDYLPVNGVKKRPEFIYIPK